jgi:N-acetylglucosaminyldiphosphoundecaprenol N-acetyl-beta-D-mannosaminyltransferase
VDGVNDMGKKNLLGVLVDALDYEAAVERIMGAAAERRGFAATALAVHGVMTGVGEEGHRYRLNHFDLVTPDGQPVRWALNSLHGTQLEDRVYGPVLTLKVCQEAAKRGLPVYFYGSTPDVLKSLVARMQERFPDLDVAGASPSKFRNTTEREKAEIADRIRASGARITFVGLGCPRQEVFAYEYRDVLRMPVVAVGAAFDYHSGTLKEPPAAIQRWGLQWAYRLVQQPRRLWRRYLLLNPAFVGLLILQRLRIWRPDPDAVRPPVGEVLYG